MRCEVCGGEYGLTHNCPGGAAANPALALEQEAAPPTGFPLAYYLRQGWAIATWDEAAIRRISKDANALPFGLAFWLVGPMLIFCTQVAALGFAGRPVNPLGLVVGFMIGVTVSTLYQALYFAVCHLVAKYVLHGTGTYLGILRPLLLSSFLFWLAAIPVVGQFVASLWWGLAVALWVFEEVHGVERLKTLAVLIALNLTFLLIQLNLPRMR